MNREQAKARFEALLALAVAEGMEEVRLRREAAEQDASPLQLKRLEKWLLANKQTP